MTECLQCGRELAEDEGLTLGDWSRATSRIYIALPGWPKRHIGLSLPQPLAFCSDQCAANWCAEAIERHWNASLDELATLRQQRHDDARRAAAAMVEDQARRQDDPIDERCTYAYQHGG